MAFVANIVTEQNFKFCYSTSFSTNQIPCILECRADKRDSCARNYSHG